MPESDDDDDDGDDDDDDDGDGDGDGSFLADEDCWEVDGQFLHARWWL